jgi:hypothetical protein
MHDAQNGADQINQPMGKWSAQIRRFAPETAFARSLFKSAITALAAPLVDISPGTQVTPHDIEQFNATWMSPDNTSGRLGLYDSAMKNRQAWIAWGIGDDATGMVRMWELTHDPQYLTHLKSIADITLQYRDDHHPGDDYPNGDNPICMKCRPPFIDRERGGVQAAWGSGLYNDYVNGGALNPVDAVTSGVYLYPIVAFARLVLEDASLQEQHGGAAMLFANAGIETFQTFASQLDYQQTAAGYIEGTINRPTVFPTSSQCQSAKQAATYHATQFSGLTGEDLKKLLDRINGAGGACDTAGGEAGLPLAHNESAALMIAYIELWRALDSAYYRDSPLRGTGASLVHALIPFVIARHQRYFLNRLQLLDNTAEGQRYRWNYNDDVPHPHIEDTSHANLDMLYVCVLRVSRDRLHAITALTGEPIALDDGHVRRFANTFLQEISRPAEIDAGGNLRADVDGTIDSDRTSDDPTYYNSTTDGWVNLAAVDPTIYRVVRDIANRQYEQDGFWAQHDLTVSNYSALLANKRYSREITNLDLRLLSNSPRAASDPFGWVFAAQDVQNVTYRAIDGHVYELWRITDGRIGYTNLSANAGAPHAASNPKPYEFPALGTHNVVYRGTDGHLHVLWWTTGAVGHDDLTALTGAPAPTGNPFPYVSLPFGVQNVVYRGTDGHLHVLYWSTGAVGHDDITRLSGAPAAAGDPFGYFITAQGVQNIVYRGVDGHLHGLYWGLDAVGHDDLTRLSNAPPPSGDATAYVTTTGLQTAVYRGTDRHIHSLYWTTGAVGHDDLSENGVPGAPLPLGNVEAYFNAEDGTNHVLYRTSNGHLHELSWTTGAVSHADLSALVPNVQPSSGKPSGYVFAPDRTQHLIYRAMNGDLHDLSWLF